MQRGIAILAVVLAGALGASGAAHAQDPFGGQAFGGERFAQQSQPGRQDPFGDMRGNFSAEEARGARDSGQLAIDSRRAIMIAQTQIPGAEYLDLEISRGGRPEYHVRLQTPDGRRVEVVIDAQTGAVLRVN